MDSRFVFSCLFLICVLQFSSVRLTFSPAPSHLRFGCDLCDVIPQDTPDPINIVSKDTTFVHTTKLSFIGALTEKWLITNTGQSVEVVIDQKSESAITVTGGVLYDDVYRFYKFRFYWHFNGTTKGQHDGTTVDGAGSTKLEIRSYFYNDKYGSFNNSLNHRDGIALISNRLNIGFLPNPLFYPFQYTMKEIKRPGDSANVLSAFASLWFANYNPTITYFAYPGSYPDEQTGKVYYCTTTVVLKKVDLNFISHAQFWDAFGHLVDSSKNPLVNVETQSPQGSRTVVKSQGFALKFVFV